MWKTYCLRFSGIAFEDVGMIFSVNKVNGAEVSLLLTAHTKERLEADRRVIVWWLARSAAQRLPCYCAGSERTRLEKECEGGEASEGGD